MLGAAFAAAAVSATTGSVWFGLGAGIATAVFLALLIGFACITHKGNQVVAGMAVTIMVAGLGPTLGLAWFGLGGQTPQLDGAGQRFTGIVLPGAAAAKEVPFPGLLYSELLSGQNLIVYLAAALVPLDALAPLVLGAIAFGTEPRIAMLVLALAPLGVLVLARRAK